MPQSKLPRKTAETLQKNMPNILGGAGIVCFLASIGLAAVNSPKAQRALEQERQKQKKHTLSWQERLRATWRLYLPVGLTAAAGAGCTIASLRESHKRTMALPAACALSESALRTYKDQVVQAIGEKKEKAVKDAAAAQKQEQVPVQEAQIAVIDQGGTLCFDVVSGRYFKTTRDRLLAAQNNLNERMLNGMEMFASLNEFYDEIGLAHIGVGDDLGWNVSKSMLKLYLSAKLLENGAPCMVMDYEVLPEYRYNI